MATVMALSAMPAFAESSVTIRSTSTVSINGETKTTEMNVEARDDVGGTIRVRNNGEGDMECEGLEGWDLAKCEGRVTERNTRGETRTRTTQVRGTRGRLDTDDEIQPQTRARKASCASGRARAAPPRVP